MTSSNRLKASIVDLTFLIWALAVPLALGHRVLNSDGDAARHLAMGEFILRGGLFQTDAFAYTHSGPFLTTEWLSQVTYALAARAGEAFRADSPRPGGSLTGPPADGRPLTGERYSPVPRSTTGAISPGTSGATVTASLPASVWTVSVSSAGSDPAIRVSATRPWTRTC